jgi:hypothetical protein
LLISTTKGLVNCYDTASGKEEWTSRMSKATVSASPIAAEGLVFISNEAGETFVVRPGQKLDLVGTNRLTAEDDEMLRASLTPHHGQILARSNKRLYCIGKAK